MVEINDQQADIFLGHPDVNSDDPYPFMLWKRIKPLDKELREEEGQALSIQISVNQDTTPITMDKAFFFTVLLKDHQLPTGVRFSEKESRKQLYEILGKGTRIYLQTSEGTYSALESDGFVITETQYEKYSLAQVRLSANNAVFLPVDNDRFTASRWLAPDISGVFNEVPLSSKPTYYKIQSHSPLAFPSRYWFRFYHDDNEFENPSLAATLDEVTDVTLDLEFKNFIYANLADGEIAKIIRTFDRDSFTVYLKNNSGTYEIFLLVGLNSGSVQTSAYAVADDEIVSIKVVFSASTAPGANDGSASLYLNNILKETLSNLDNDTKFISFYLFGWKTLDTFTNPSGKLYVGDVQAAVPGFGYITNWSFPVAETSLWGPDDDAQAYWR